MIHLKSEKEIETIREAGRILHGVLHAVRDACAAGVRTRDLDALAESYIRERGAKPAFKGYKGFPATLTISINEEVVHGIPSGRKLRVGDLVGVDCGVVWDGYIADSALTVPIGEITEANQKLLKVTEEALYLGIAQAVSGNHVKDISKAIQEHVEGHGFSVVRELVGHGVGREMHEEPQVPNYQTGKKGAKLEPGMVIAIEPMVNAGGYPVSVKADKWTIVSLDRSPSAHFEHTVAITKNGPQILTNGE